MPTDDVLEPVDPPGAEAIREAASDVAAWTRTVLGRALRPYQEEVAAAVLDSVRYQRGLTFTVMMARQMGKNETSAVLESYLLALFRRIGGTILKAAPTLRPQAVNSRRRLSRMLDNPLARGRWEMEASTILRWDRCEVHFASAGPAANIVGATADILLELDECQDLTHEKIDRDLRPMTASTNATRVYYGTAWTADNPLEVQRRHNLELEARDGIRRHFEYDWRVLAKLSEQYRRYVEDEIARLGWEHPIIRTQYFLEPLDDANLLFPRPMREAMLGRFGPLPQGLEGEYYVAGIDVAGQDQALAIGTVQAPQGKGGRDATVCVIGRVRYNEEHEVTLEVVALAAWSGAQMEMQQRWLLGMVSQRFACAKVVVDATGLGAPAASYLARKLGKRVEQFSFTLSSKSRLGYDLLALAGTNRLQVYQMGSREAEEHQRRLFRELEVARREFRANEIMTFGVPAKEGHDDYLMALALCVRAATSAPPPPVSAVIPPQEEFRPRHGDGWDEVW